MKNTLFIPEGKFREISREMKFNKIQTTAHQYELLYHAVLFLNLFSSLMPQAYSKTTMPGFIGLRF